MPSNNLAKRREYCNYHIDMKKLHIPQFWYSTDANNKSPLLSIILWPLSALYQMGDKLNRLKTNQKPSPLPVICVGNITMGGGGKTPTARALLKMIQDHGKFATPCFLMRGYGGNNKGPIEVDLTTHTSWDVGDEALMQAHYAPTIIASDRYDGAVLAEKLGYDLIIMDDGFQNYRLEKTLSFIVIDGGFGFGNGKTFPSGPLREPIKPALKRANACIIINKTDDINLSILNKKRHYHASINLLNNGQKTKGKKVIAMAGIARPEKFFDTLEQNGYELYAHYGFSDHHVYTHGELQAIVERAERHNISVITTEKDWIRLSEKWREKISYLKISIEFDDKFKIYFNKCLDHIK